MEVCGVKKGETDGQRKKPGHEQTGIEKPIHT